MDIQGYGGEFRPATEPTEIGPVGRPINDDEIIDKVCAALLEWRDTPMGDSGFSDPRDELLTVRSLARRIVAMAR